MRPVQSIRLADANRAGMKIKRRMVTRMKKIAIGGGQGFWGDSPDAAVHMIRNADIQYM